MKTHLKTIAILSLVGSLICLIIIFPKIMMVTLSITAFMVLYYSTYKLFKANEKEEQMGPNNAGGRDLD